MLLRRAHKALGATERVNEVNCELNRNVGLDVWPWVVIDELEVLILEREEVLDIGIDEHLGEWARGASELQLCLLKMVEV